MTGTGRNKAFIAASILIFTFFVCLNYSPAGPNTLNRDEIPQKYKWNFSDVYPDWNAWENDLGLMEAKMEEIKLLKGTLASGPQQLLKSYRLDDELTVMAYKLYRYPALMSYVDTRDNEVSARLQRVSILFAQFSTATAWIQPEILTIPWETMAKWLKENKELEPYRFGIENLYRQQKHVLDEDKERLLSYYNQFDGTPTDIYTHISTSDIKYKDTTLSDGKTYTITESKYQNILATYRNQADRKLAFETLYGVYNDQVNTYAAIYNSVLQSDWANAQARNYESCLESYLDADNVPVDVYKNLIATVKSHTEPLQRYQKLRKQRLGLETYHPFDSRIPLVDFKKVYEYDDITGWVVDAVKPLGKEYQNKMKNVFKGGWVDVYENEGKTTGAFSANILGVHPYILLNYQETLEDVFTVVHEAGHAMHSVLSNENQPVSTSGYTIFVAEVASTLNEALFLDYMLEKSNDPVERIALLQQAIDNVIGNIYTQVMFADFELQAHELVEQGQPITSEVLEKLYLDLEHEYYGDVTTVDSLYGCLWARIGHFYYSPYYVYKYSTSFATSAEIVKEILSKDKKTSAAALDRYLTLLKSGGNDYPMEQLKKAGVDLSKPEPILAIIEHFDNLVTRLDAELKKL
jgi:oligoendopeptidase F